MIRNLHYSDTGKPFTHTWSLPLRTFFLMSRPDLVSIPLGITRNDLVRIQPVMNSG